MWGSFLKCLLYETEIKRDSFQVFSQLFQSFFLIPLHIHTHIYKYTRIYVNRQPSTFTDSASLDPTHHRHKTLEKIQISKKQNLNFTHTQPNYLRCILVSYTDY